MELATAIAELNRQSTERAKRLTDSKKWQKAVDALSNWRESAWHNNAPDRWPSIINEFFKLAKDVDSVSRLRPAWWNSPAENPHAQAKELAANWKESGDPIRSIVGDCLVKAIRKPSSTDKSIKGLLALDIPDKVFTLWCEHIHVFFEQVYFPIAKAPEPPEEHRPMHERDCWFFNKYNAKGEATYHKPAKIAQAWNAEHPGVPVTRHVVTEGIKKVRKEHDRR